MNTETRLQKCTVPFNPPLLKELAELGFAKGYQNLAYLLRVKHPLQLDKTLDILSGLKECRRTHPAEEMRSVAHEKSGDSEEHDENHAG